MSTLCVNPLYLADFVDEFMKIHTLHRHLQRCMSNPVELDIEDFMNG